MKLKTLAIGIFYAVVCTAQAQNNDTKGTDANAKCDMKPPAPLQNKVYDAMVGDWSGESNMMGMKAHERVKIEWALNHQFLIMKLAATGITHPNMKYEGMGIFGVDAKGKAKTWWFDNWGAEAMSIGRGEFADNKLTLTDGNAMFQETRTFEIKGLEMIMHAKGTMNWKGKQTPFENTTVYKKN